MNNLFLAAFVGLSTANNARIKANIGPGDDDDGDDDDDFADDFDEDDDIWRWPLLACLRLITPA